MRINGTPGQTLIAYYAQRATPEHDALTLLDRSPLDGPDWSHDEAHIYLASETEPDPR
jgi:hypothetical protein